MTTVRFTLDLDGHLFTHEEVDAELITEAIGTLDGDDTYVVLEPDATIASSAYMQTVPIVPAGKYSDDSLMLVETRLEHPDGGFTHLRREDCDREETCRIFVDYWAESRLPDLTQFEDVTEEFLEPDGREEVGDYYSAYTENGDYIDDPSEDALYWLISDLDNDTNRFVVVRPYEDIPEWSASVTTLSSGGFQVECRDDRRSEHDTSTSQDGSQIAHDLTLWLAARFRP